MILWDYNELSKNPNITFDIVKANPGIPWNYFLLCDNKMTKPREDFIGKYQEQFKKSSLKEELIANLWNPKNYDKFKYYDPELFDET